MKSWDAVPFGDLLVESRDGEWGQGQPEIGHTEAVVIRGTDFAGVNDPEQRLPHRWIKNHLVERKRLRPRDIVFEMAGGTSTQSTGRSALLKHGFFERNAPLPAMCASFSRHLRLDLSNSTLAIFAASQHANCLKIHEGRKLEGVSRAETLKLKPLAVSCETRKPLILNYLQFFKNGQSRVQILP